MIGLEQAAKVAPSSEHSKVEPGSLALNVNDAVELGVEPAGPVPRTVFGAVVSTTTVRAADSLDVFPAASVAVAVMSHVELTDSRAWQWPVRYAVDHEAAGAADAFAAVVVEGDRLPVLVDQAFVHNVEHLKERHVFADVGRSVDLEVPGRRGTRLTPNLEREVEGHL